MADINFDDFLSPELKETMERMKNIGIPSTTAGSGKVPHATNLKILNKVTYEDRVDVALQFFQPPDLSPNNKISCYRIYATGAILQNQFSSPFTVSTSPAEISIPITPKSSGTVTLTVQTVMENGFSTPISLSPSTTFFVASTATSSSTFISNYNVISTNNTTFATLNISANTLKPNATIAFKIYGKINFPAAANQAASIQLYINNAFVTGRVLSHSPAVAGAESTNFDFDSLFLFKTSTSLAASTALNFDSSTLTIASYNQYPPTIGLNTVVVDTTQNITIDLRVGIAIGTPTVQIHNGYYNILNNI